MIKSRICTAYIVSTVSCAVVLVAAAYNGNVVGSVATAVCTNREAESEESSLECDQSRDMRYKIEFERLVASTNLSPTETWSKSGALCEEIAKLPKAESLPLLDLFLKMAIDRNIAETNLTLRQVRFEQLFHITRASFCFSQGLRKESFSDWDQLFKFFKKVTDEIATVEQDLSRSERDGWRCHDARRRDYLHKLKGDFKVWVHVIQDLHFPSLGEGLTTEQKADVIRRFNELQQYMKPLPREEFRVITVSEEEKRNARFRKFQKK